MRPKEIEYKREFLLRDWFDNSNMAYGRLLDFGLRYQDSQRIATSETGL
jgi:hypothetical protein